MTHRIDDIIAGKAHLWKNVNRQNHNPALDSIYADEGYFIRIRPCPRAEMVAIQLESADLPEIFEPPQKSIASAMPEGE